MHLQPIQSAPLTTMCLSSLFSGLVMTVTVRGLAVSGTDRPRGFARSGMPRAAAKTTTSASIVSPLHLTPVHSPDCQRCAVQQTTGACADVRSLLSWRRMHTLIVRGLLQQDIRRQISKPPCCSHPNAHELVLLPAAPESFHARAEHKQHCMPARPY